MQKQNQLLMKTCKLVREVDISVFLIFAASERLLIAKISVIHRFCFCIKSLTSLTEEDTQKNLIKRIPLPRILFY